MGLDQLVGFPAKSKKLDKDGKEKAAHWEDDPGGRGCEIVKEVVMCASCAVRTLAIA